MILISVVKSVGQYRKTSGSSFDALFDDVITSDICKVLMPCGFLQLALGAMYQRYVRVTRLVLQYPETLQLVENSNDGAAARDSADGKDGLGIAHLDTASLFKTEKCRVLYLSRRLSKSIQKQHKEEENTRVVQTLRLLLLCCRAPEQA